MNSLDTTYIDNVLKGWEDFKSSLPDVEGLIAKGDEIIRELKEK